MLKKIISIILVCVLSLSLSVNVFAADLDTNSDFSTPNVINGDWETDENGALTCTVKIPAIWESRNSTRALSDCKLIFTYHGSGAFSYAIVYSALDLITNMQGTVSTYGVAGTANKNFYEESKYIPLAQLSHAGEFLFSPRLVSGNQFLKVVGTVNGVNGSGSFGPTVMSVAVSPDMKTLFNYEGK